MAAGTHRNGVFVWNAKTFEKDASQGVGYIGVDFSPDSTCLCVGEPHSLHLGHCNSRTTTNTPTRGLRSDRDSRGSPFRPNLGQQRPSCLDGPPVMHLMDDCRGKLYPGFNLEDVVRVWPLPPHSRRSRRSSGVAVEN